MGLLRPLNVRARRQLLRWRTRRGRATAVRQLDLLAVTVGSKGYRCVKLYQADEFPTRPPLLWVFAFAPGHHVRVAVSVQATPGGTWGYYEAGRGRHGYLSPCGDTKYAADQVDTVLSSACSPAPGREPKAGHHRPCCACTAPRHCQRWKRPSRAVTNKRNGDRP